LRERAMQVIKKRLLKPEDAFLLEIPRQLQKEISGQD
jgi:hypothetical protein